MIGEILTGIVTGATFGYLYARKKYQERGSQDPVEPLVKVTFTASAAPKHEHYWWQEFGAQKYTNQQKLPETKEKLEEYLKNQMNEYPPPMNGPDQAKGWSDWELQNKNKNGTPKGVSKNVSKIHDMISKIKNGTKL